MLDELIQQRHFRDGDEHMERVQRLARRQLGVMGCSISTVLRGKGVSKIRDHVCVIVVTRQITYVFTGQVIYALDHEQALRPARGYSGGQSFEIQLLKFVQPCRFFGMVKVVVHLHV